MPKVMQHRRSRKIVIEKRVDVIENNFYYFRVTVSAYTMEQTVEMAHWCENNIPVGRWTVSISNLFFYFKAEEEAVLFRLRFA